MKIFSRRPSAAQPSQDQVTQGPADVEHGQVAGERGAPSVSRAATLQSRVSNALAIALMAALGVGILGWYYSRTLSQPARARDEAKTASRAQAQGDVTLPPLGPIDPQPSENASMATGLLGPPPEAPPPDDVPEAWLKPAQDMPAASAPQPYGPPTKTPEELALERRLSGPVVANALGGSLSAAALSASESDADGATGSEETPSAAAGSVAALLRPSVMPAARARVLPTRRLLLPKGAFVDCTLETAIDSTLPGMTTCITATDTFSADGSVVLLERGTKLLGETRGQVQQGSARIFVLWSEARTPTGVVIPLASPGTDELGRSGLPGHVNRHFWDRFGAAILVTVINGAVQREVQTSNGGGAVIYDPSATQDVMTEVLKSTVNIPPTVTKNNGDRIQILVARDLDFRSVYELRPAARASR